MIAAIIILRNRWITHMPCGYHAGGRSTSIGCCSIEELVSTVPCMLTNHIGEEVVETLKAGSLSDPVGLPENAVVLAF